MNSTDESEASGMPPAGRHLVQIIGSIMARAPRLKYLILMLYKFPIEPQPRAKSWQALQIRCNTIISTLLLHSTVRTAALAKHLLQIPSEVFRLLGCVEVPTGIVFRLVDNGAHGSAP